MWDAWSRAWPKQSIATVGIGTRQRHRWSVRGFFFDIWLKTNLVTAARARVPHVARAQEPAGRRIAAPRQQKWVRAHGKLQRTSPLERTVDVRKRVLRRSANIIAAALSRRVHGLRCHGQHRGACIMCWRRRAQHSLWVACVHHLRCRTVCPTPGTSTLILCTYSPSEEEGGWGCG